jgi:hypothetical protein
MTKTLYAALSAAMLLLGLGATTPLSASQDDFCRGFEEGYKTIKGDMVLVPLCPLAPVTPLGSTDYREGIKAGMKAAQR